MGTPDANTASTLARVQVTVIRNTPPSFINKENYNVAIPMTRLAGEVIFRTNFTDADTRVSFESKYRRLTLQVCYTHNEDVHGEV